LTALTDCVDYWPMSHQCSLSGSKCEKLWVFPALCVVLGFPRHTVTSRCCGSEMCRHGHRFARNILDLRIDSRSLVHEQLQIWTDADLIPC